MNTLMETDAKGRVSKELLLEAIDDFEKIILIQGNVFLNGKVRWLQKQK